MRETPMHKQRKITAFLLIIITVITATGIIYALFPIKYESEIKKYSDKFGVDRYIITALIKAESNFNSKAVSSAGAYGIMQLTKDTFDYCMKSLNIKTSENEVFNDEKNIMAGTWYMAQMLKKYNGDITCSVAAYNAGAANVDKWLKNGEYSEDGKKLSYIPFGETQRHVKKIKVYMRIYKLLYPSLKK